MKNRTSPPMDVLNALALPMVTTLIEPGSIRPTEGVNERHGRPSIVCTGSHRLKGWPMSCAPRVEEPERAPVRRRSRWLGVEEQRLVAAGHQARTRIARADARMS